MITADERAYLLQLAQKSVLGTPLEYDAYMALKLRHSSFTKNRWIVIRSFHNSSCHGDLIPRPINGEHSLILVSDAITYVRLQGGAEVKAAMPFMVSLPPPAFISNLSDVKDILQTCSFQAEEQAKAAVKDVISPLTRQSRGSCLWDPILPGSIYHLSRPLSSRLVVTSLTPQGECAHRDAAFQPPILYIFWAPWRLQTR